MALTTNQRIAALGLTKRKRDEWGVTWELLRGTEVVFRGGLREINAYLDREERA